MKEIKNYIRLKFFGKLKDFLPKNLKREIKYEYLVSTSVKDLIESFNVPHTEVDVILVNNKSVDFDYLINHGDLIRVYPEWRKTKLPKVIHLKPKLPNKIRFICDVHLGKLTRYLRILGVDVIYNNSLSDEEIANISVKTRRVILTRDIGLLKRKNIKFGYYVRQSLPEKQLKEVISNFNLFKQFSPFSLCLKCGEKIKPIQKEKALETLKGYSFPFETDFYKCKKCNKIYWEGSHFERMNLSIIKFLRR